MIQLKVSDVLRECEGELFCGDNNLLLTRFSKDTRTLQSGDVYIGIQGENFDGNQFYLEALKKGACCCILEYLDEKTFDNRYSDRTIILVKNTIDAIQKLAAFKRSLLHIPIIAITGSVGKTSTKDMITEILKQKYQVYKTPGNLNGQIGLPLSILELQNEEIMVLEMGMNDFGQISKLTNIAKPTIGVITNIGSAHIGMLGSKENILKAKMEILEGMNKNSHLILNGDDELLSNIDFVDYQIRRCSLKNSKATYHTKNIQIEDQLSHYNVEYGNENYEVTIPVMGNGFIMNSLLAIAVGDLLNVSAHRIQLGLKNFQLSKNRMEMISCSSNITIINDTYNSNYEAIVNALDILKRYSKNRKLVVLGDVLELEEYASKIHYEIGLIPDLKEVDLLFLNGENAKYIKEGALNSGFSKDKVFYFESRDELEKSLLNYIQSGDTILIKASHGMQFQFIVDKLKESYVI